MHYRHLLLFAVGFYFLLEPFFIRRTSQVYKKFFSVFSPYVLSGVLFGVQAYPTMPGASRASTARHTTMRAAQRMVEGGGVGSVVVIYLSGVAPSALDRPILRLVAASCCCEVLLER